MKPGTNNNDVVVKAQIQSVEGSSPGTVVNDKAVIYSGTGSVHAQSLHLKDAPDDGISNELRILTPHQSYNNIHLNIPDSKNFDGHSNRPSSFLMVTSVGQSVTGKKTFQNIEVPNPTTNNQATNKYYVDHNFLNRLTGGQIGGALDMRGNTIKYLKLDNTDSAAARVAELKLKLNRSGDTMTGDLILQQQPYPVQGNTNKAISYNTVRAIFLSKKEGGQMESVLDMNGHYITNIRDPVNTDHGVNKKYVDNEIAKITTVDTNQFVWKSGSTMTGDLDMDSNFVRNVGIDLADSTSAMPKSYIDAISQNVISYPITGDINLTNFKIRNLKSPEGDNNAINREYLNQKISESHVETSDKTNQFKYLNDPVQLSSERNITVNSFGDWTNE